MASKRALLGWIVCCGVAAAAIGCSARENNPSRSDGGAATCTMDNQCDDSIACTLDTCGAGGACQHNAINERCATGETCSPIRGCTNETTCTMNSDCDDAVDCTLDTCGVGNVCRHMALNERCTNGGTCHVTQGCQAPIGCSTMAECDDEIACTVDTCGVDRACRHMAVDSRCPSGQMCSSTTGCTLPCNAGAPNPDEACQDGNVCNGREVCVAEFGCMASDTPLMCDDGVACTTNTCVNETGCVYTCDPTISGCTCGGPTTYAGTYDITPSVAQSCVFGMVNYDFSSIVVTLVGPILTFDAGIHMDTRMTQASPALPAFDVVGTISGGCTETYRIMGTFTETGFTGTWTARYVGECSIGIDDCVNQTIPITGTRRL